MNIKIDDVNYEVKIIKKNIKNTYIRVKPDMVIYVSTNKLTPKFYIEKLLEDNKNEIKKMIDTQIRKNEKENYYYLLGKRYDIVLCNIYQKVEIDENKVYTKNLNMLIKYTREFARKIFEERLEKCYSKMKNEVPYPILKVRKMKGKWGYCNKKEKVVMLNLNLIKYDIDEIDYVIIHELCHFIHFNHSKEFWKSVKYYKPNYKKNRKVLKEE